MEQQEAKPKNHSVFISIIIAVFLIVGAIFISKNPSSSQYKSAKLNTEKKQVNQQQKEINKEEFNIEFDGWPTMGNPESSVIIVEYSDFVCPFCSRFWKETFPSIKRDYIDKGKVLFVYKDFVIVGGEKAAEAAHCANEQGKFWEYHDKLFSRNDQDRFLWTDPEIHRAYAREIGLDENAFLKCFNEQRYQEKVSLSTKEAMQNGGQGTPYFLINGKAIVGAQPYSVFKEVIDLALNEK